MTRGASTAAQPNAGFSLAGTIDFASARMPRALAGNAALSAVRRLADTLPAALTNWVDLECRLQHRQPQIDLSLRIDRRGRDRLLRHALMRQTTASASAVAAWRRVAVFAREWADESTTVAHDVEGLWLEFDIARGSPTDACSPRVFLDLARTARAPARSVGAAASALAPFLGLPVPAWVRDGIARVLSALPPGAELLYVGLPAHERIDAVRLCVIGLTEGRAIDHLDAIGWPGDVRALHCKLTSWRRAGADTGAHDVTLHVDLDQHGRIGPRLGFEYPLRRRPQVKGDLADAALLDDLVAAGACTAAKRDAVLAWPGCEMAILPHEVWPSLVMRRVSHVKIVHDGDQPLEAKAYCCFAHAWRPRLARDHRLPPLSAPRSIAL